MSPYIPFLKTKSGELNAMSLLAPKVKQSICPFFDFHRRKPDYIPETYAGAALGIAKSLKTHWGTDQEFYFDDLDIGQKFKVNGEHQYAFMLKALKELKVIPVVALDRTIHNDAVAQLKRDGEIASAIVAFRAEKEDFEDFKAKEDVIDYDLGAVFKKFKAIDLIFDCRLCTGMNPSETAQQIADFAQKFGKAYDVRRVIVTGSSIPATLGDVVKAKSTEIVPRHELAIIAKARGLCDADVIAGDYATVSPFYSDKQFKPELLQKVTAPRLIYSFNHSHYIRRGASLESGGQDQYFGMTKELCVQKFFREDFSFGEVYFAEKTKRIGKNASNASVVKPSVVAHVTYMVMGAKL
jgi:Beta protein